MNSYIIHSSCRDYNGRGLTIAVRTAVKEVRHMARIVLDTITDPNPNPATIRLIHVLFGAYLVPKAHFFNEGSIRRLIGFSNYRANFYVICGDRDVTLTDWATGLPSDTRGLWADHQLGWVANYDQFFPCDPARRPENPYQVAAFTMENRYIYICPPILESSKGTLLRPYREEHLAGAWIDDYMLLSVYLFHELLQTRVLSEPRKFWFRFVYHINSG